MLLVSQDAGALALAHFLKLKGMPENEEQVLAARQELTASFPAP